MRAPRAVIVACVGLFLCAGAAWGQDAAALVITVVDPSGAVLVGANVTVTLEQSVASEGPTLRTNRAEHPDNAATAAATGPDGTATIGVPQPGRARVHVEAAGFEAADLDVQVRRTTRRTVKLRLAKVLETVNVGRDPRERASDPRSDAFATILGAEDIRELPDDPDEMERVLREMAGPGAVMRVNGFRGGRLPPKDQIAQIRFHRNMFAADAHEPGFLSVDIITKPGLENWRGSTGFGFRDAAMNARNAFAPARGDERNQRGSFTLTGPLWRQHTSLSLSVDGTSAYDSQAIRAATSSGLFAQSVRRPTDAANLTARLEHGLTPNQQLRIEWQRNHTAQDDLGVGNYDLPSRAYSQSRTEQVVRGSVAGGIGRSLYNELRVSWRGRDTTSRSMVQEPTVTVLNAFTSGGAQIDGERSIAEFELGDDLDIARGRHAIRTGFLVESGRYATTERRNALGTYTFADLASYRAQRPTSFTRTIGDPAAAIVQTRIGGYVQDDIRMSRTLTLSVGVRHEYQTTIGGLHLGPRGGFAWSPFQSGKTTVRGGAGIFFDWFDADDALRATQLDGAHQQIETIVAPAYPAVAGTSAGVRLGNGRVRLARSLDQPVLREMNLAVEQSLGPVRLNTMLFHRRGSHNLRGVDLNAPVAGVRPDAADGPMTEVRSIARSGVDGMSVNLNFMQPERRIFVAANYTLSRSFDEADSPLALPAEAANLAAEHGPAADDARHRAMGFVNVPITRRLSAGVSFNVRSALPYDITTGHDDNGDSLSTDRPAGTTRNTGRGRLTADINARAAWRLGFGGAPSQGPGGPQVRIVRGGSDFNPLGDVPGGPPTSRYTVEIYAQVFNALNHLNATAFSGVMASPFFGQPVAAAAARRVELGARLAF